MTNPQQPFNPNLPFSTPQQPATAAAPPPPFWSQNAQARPSSFAAPPPSNSNFGGGAAPLPFTRPRSASPLGSTRPIPGTPQPPTGLGDRISQARSQTYASARQRRQNLESELRACETLLKSTTNALHQQQWQQNYDNLVLKWQQAQADVQRALDAITQTAPSRNFGTPLAGTRAFNGQPPAQLVFPSPSPVSQPLHYVPPSSPSPHPSSSTPNPPPPPNPIIITSSLGIPGAVIVSDLGLVNAAASSQGLREVTTEQKQRVKERLRDAAKLVGAHAVVQVQLRRDPNTNHLYGSGRAVKLVLTAPQGGRVI